MERKNGNFRSLPPQPRQPSTNRPRRTSRHPCGDPKGRKGRSERARTRWTSGRSLGKYEAERFRQKFLTMLVVRRRIRTDGQFKSKANPRKIKINLIQTVLFNFYQGGMRGLPPSGVSKVCHRIDHQALCCNHVI